MKLLAKMPHLLAYVLAASQCLSQVALAAETPQDQTTAKYSRGKKAAASHKAVSSNKKPSDNSVKAKSPKNKHTGKSKSTSKTRGTNATVTSAGQIPRPAFPTTLQTGPHFTTAKASLQLTVNGKAIPYQRFFYTLTPKQALHFQLSNTNDPYELAIDGQVVPENQHHWQWQAPDKPGQHQLQLVEKLTHKTLTLTLFVLAPMKGSTFSIRGFQIGRYPEPKDGKKEYEAPKGFIEVTPSNVNTFVSPHFQLGQFVCKQKCDLPTFVALQPDLLEKLELLLERVNEKGFRLDTFEVMSGFRTPFYNRLIRNVIHSRHIYGSAADIFIDINPRDGVMDDLNGDHKFDKKDAAVLYDMADDISRTHPYLAGGVGQYSGNGAHGPFVHVDVRGSDARWGM